MLRFVEGPLVDFLGADQIKTIGLLDGRAHFALFQSEYSGFDRLRVSAVLLDYAEVAILGGGGLIVGIFTRQLAEIGAILDLFCQILDLGLRLGFGGQLLAIGGGFAGRGIERHVDHPHFHFLKFVGIVLVVLLLIFLG